MLKWTTDIIDLFDVDRGENMNERKANNLLPAGVLDDRQIFIDVDTNNLFIEPDNGKYLEPITDKQLKEFKNQRVKFSIGG